MVGEASLDLFSKGNEPRSIRLGKPTVSCRTDIDQEIRSASNRIVRWRAYSYAFRLEYAETLHFKRGDRQLFVK